MIQHKPYNYVYQTFAKNRWLGKKYVDILTIEFKDYSRQYFEQALTIGQVQIIRQMNFLYSKDLVAKDSDIILHFTHRHESPIFEIPIVTNTNIIFQINNIDINMLVCYKPSGVPVHPSSHYNKHSLINLVNFHSINRLDRLVSGYLLGSPDDEYLKANGIQLSQQQITKHLSQLIIQKGIFKCYIAETVLNNNYNNNDLIIVYKPIKELLQTETQSLSRYCDYNFIQTIYTNNITQEIDQVIQQNKIECTHKAGILTIHIKNNTISDSLKSSIYTILSLLQSNINNNQQIQHSISVFYKITENFILCSPITGRTHQLRIHLKCIDQQIIDDPLYGGDISIIRQELIKIEYSNLHNYINIAELREDCKNKLINLKALKHKNVNLLLNNLILNTEFQCTQCEYVNNQDENEDPLIIKNGVVKIQNPQKYIQRRIRLHNFYYKIKDCGTFFGQQPCWCAGYDQIIADSTYFFSSLIV